MPSLGDSAFLFILALLLFGPKKLPELARQLGKLMGEFRRASNEFRLQMEEELRLSEQAEKQKQIAALEAAATPPLPALEASPDLTSESSDNPARHLHAAPASAEALIATTESPSGSETPATIEAAEPLAATEPATMDGQSQVHPAGAYANYPDLEIPPYDPVAEPPAPPSPPPASLEHTPIATNGDLHLMPPATGLPTPRTSSSITPFIDAVPHAEPELSHTPAPAATEESLHG